MAGLRGAAAAGRAAAGSPAAAEAALTTLNAHHAATVPSRRRGSGLTVASGLGFIGGELPAGHRQIARTVPPVGKDRPTGTAGTTFLSFAKARELWSDRPPAGSVPDTL
jgi:hypothetical protein